MKNLKKVLFIAILFIISGCSIDYNLIITSDKKIVESITIIQPNNKIKLYNEDIKTYVEDEISQLKSNPRYNGYKFNYKIEEEFTKITRQKEYKQFEEFKKTNIFSYLFEDIHLVSNEREYKIGTTGRFINPNIGENNEPDYYIEKININIRFHNDVISSNADSIDDKSNTHTWVVNANDIQKSIEFKLGNSKRYDIIIIDFIKMNLVSIIFVSSLILVIIITCLGIYTNYRRNNHI